MNRWDFENYKQQTAQKLLGMVEQQKAKTIVAEDRARGIKRLETADVNAAEKLSYEKGLRPGIEADKAIARSVLQGNYVDRLYEDATTLPQFQAGKKNAITLGIDPSLFPDYTDEKQYLADRDKRLYEKIRVQGKIAAETREAGKMEPTERFTFGAGINPDTGKEETTKRNNLTGEVTFTGIAPIEKPGKTGLITDTQVNSALKEKIAIEKSGIKNKGYTDGELEQLDNIKNIINGKKQQDIAKKIPITIDTLTKQYPPSAFKRYRHKDPKTGVMFFSDGNTWRQIVPR